MATGGSGPQAAFILLAEFDIDTGSGLKHHYPHAPGTSEHILADLMLPDGAHDRTEDWTVFFLNQPPRLLYVISLVRTRKDASVRRGAVCKAMAVCSPHPYIQIFKPILLLALEDYFAAPSIDCLAQLYHALNTMDTSGMPSLSHHERIVLRCSERSDLFEEKFAAPEITNDALRAYLTSHSTSLATSPLPSSVSMGRRGSGPLAYAPSLPSSASFVSFDQQSVNSLTRSSSGSTDSLPQQPAFHQTHTRTSSNTLVIEPQTIQASSSSPLLCSTFAGVSSSSNGGTPGKRPKDTHFYDSRILYGGKSIPVRIPLQTFPEEVGEYSLIQLVQTFSTPNALNPNGPIHPHLHTNGHSTHPIILLFNALITQKRIVFLGHGLPAGVVSQMVLAACALGSGCGGVLEGFTERAFPYSNLTIYEDFRAVPGYIAGVTNPIFELHTESWDVFCNIETGKITISKDIVIPTQQPQLSRSFSPLPPERSLTETGLGLTTGGGGKSGEDMSKSGSTGSGNNMSLSSSKIDASRESVDQVFIDDILSAISSHFGEPTIRSRFTDYVRRFIRIASRWEEENLGCSYIGPHTKSFESPCNFLNTNTLQEKMDLLGSGPVFGDDIVSVKRELNVNSNRIEAWRETKSYKLYRANHARGKSQSSFKFDIEHQLSRMRVSKKMAEVEVQAIYEVLVSNLQTHQEIIEILSHAPAYSGGLSPFVFGLFHPSERIRSLTVDLIRKIESNPTGQKFFQSLNSFHKLAYQRLAHQQQEQQQQQGLLGYMSLGDLSSSSSSSNSGFGYDQSGLSGSGFLTGVGGSVGGISEMTGTGFYED